MTDWFDKDTYAYMTKYIKIWSTCLWK